MRFKISFNCDIFIFVLQVKRMSTDIPFILDAMHGSSTVEVQVRFLHYDIFAVSALYTDFSSYIILW